ncbi:hypothetical protein WHZ78_17560 [Bradyrhizobium symbiodeficiens]|uniref:hypothetical protein n=1 Tax=Bradyrhizobium symbiodeficiens TaxID=1404367 RepID=UPI0030CE100E
MKATPISEVILFSSLKPGDCYFFDRSGKTVFGIAIQQGDDSMAAFVFSKEDRKGGAPWVASGAHPYTVAGVVDPELRPDISSIHFNNPGIGELIGTLSKYYIQGAAGSEVGTANLLTGKQQRPPQDAPFACYSKWSIGCQIDGRMVPVFSFPEDLT